MDHSIVRSPIARTAQAQRIGKISQNLPSGRVGGRSRQDIGESFSRRDKPVEREQQERRAVIFASYITNIARS
jgi:hypothetical protein